MPTPPSPTPTGTASCLEPLLPVGHASGRRIVALSRTKKADLTADDGAHVAEGAGYVHRHLAQHPGGDVAETRWRYSLMNWGLDARPGPLIVHTT
jgi:hypothetical protein